MKETLAMKIASLVWDGPPDDPMEYAQPCPHCGELPEWERAGKYSPRWRLNCCHLRDYDQGHTKNQEIDEVISWNETVEWEKEGIAWAAYEREKEASHAEEDAWADANLPMPA